MPSVARTAGASCGSAHAVWSRSPRTRTTPQHRSSPSLNSWQSCCF